MNDPTRQPGPYVHWSSAPADIPAGCGPGKSDDLLAEPHEGTAVRDEQGSVWLRDGDLWYMAGERKGCSWPPLVAQYGPLWLLVDGPVLT